MTNLVGRYFGEATNFGIYSKFGEVNWSFSSFGGIFLEKTEDDITLAFF